MQNFYPAKLVNNIWFSLLVYMFRMESCVCVWERESNVSQKAKKNQGIEKYIFWGISSSPISLENLALICV